MSAVTAALDEDFMPTSSDGVALEVAVSGTLTAELGRAEVWRPAGMVRTLPNNVWRIIPDRARHYQMRTDRNADWWWFTPGQKEEMEVGRLYNARLEDTSHKLPAGGLASTALDLARFGSAVVEGRLLSDATLQAMFTERTVPGDSAGAVEGTGWGLGWSLDRRNGHRIAGLGGGQAGVSAVLTTLPDEDFVVAAVANRDLVPLSDLVASLAILWGFNLSTD